MADLEFTERENPDFSDFSGFGELPEDLRATGPITLPDGSFYPGLDGDMYSLSGGATRPFVEPIPGVFGQSTTGAFEAISYFPRANAPSFRSQRFILAGEALLPPDPTTFVDLLVDIASLGPSPPQTVSTGVFTIPQGFAGVITGVSQWVGDATAFQKPNGAADDITWRVAAGGTPVFNFGNVPCLLSTLGNEAEMFVIVNENTVIQASARNNIDSSDSLARDIPVKIIVTGHQFPVDELDDIFRNR